MREKLRSTGADTSATFSAVDGTSRPVELLLSVDRDGPHTLGAQIEEQLRTAIRDLSRRYQVDIEAFCEELCMTWDELAQLASDPLVTIGAHTVNHVMLKKVPEKVARNEMAMSRSVIAASLGIEPQHLAYPVGDPTSAGQREFRIAQELGFKTAVTTRPGVVFAQHRDHLMALPRLSVNGEYQRMRYLRVLMSGAATAMWNGFKPVNAT
jgi:peptidoglycan/xylan/chitin deacetylase (PgdA/CDA1 family)